MSTQTPKPNAGIPYIDPNDEISPALLSMAGTIHAPSGNPSWFPDFIDKEPRYFTLADWGLAYRTFVERMKGLDLWPFKTEKERRDAWKIFKAHAVYLVGI